MGRLRLHETEVRASRLPDLCMVCGERAATDLRRNFQWCPWWAVLALPFGLIPYIIIALVLTKRMKVSVPLCDQHRGHFYKRTWLIYGSILGCFAISGLVCGGGLALAGPREEDKAAIAGVITFAILLAAAVIVIIVAQCTGVRPEQITDRDITLLGVDDHFIDAFEEMRETRRARRRDEDDDDDDDYDRPPPRRRQRDDDYDDRPRRRRANDD